MFFRRLRKQAPQPISNIASIAYDQPELFALMFSDVEMPELIALINTAHKKHPTYLHKIAESQHQSLIQSILTLAKQNAELRLAVNEAFLRQDEDGNTPLHLMLNNTNVDFKGNVYPWIIEIISKEILNQALPLYDKKNKKTVLSLLLDSEINRNGWSINALLEKVDDIALNNASTLVNIRGNSILLDIIQRNADQVFEAIFPRLTLKSIQYMLSAKNRQNEKVLHFTTANNVDILLKLINAAKKADLNDKLIPFYAWFTYKKINAFSDDDVLVFDAIIKKADAKLIFEMIDKLSHKQLEKLKSETQHALFAKDPFSFLATMAIRRPFCALKEPTMFKFMQNAKGLLYPEAVADIQAFLTFVRSIFPQNHNQIMYPNRWLKIFGIILNKVKQSSSERNQLLALIGRVHFSSQNKNKNNLALAEAAWAKIDSPQDLSPLENHLIGNIFKSNALSTQSHIKKAELNRKYLLHWQYAIQQEKKTQAEPSSAFILNAYTASTDDEKGVDFDSKEVDELPLQNEIDQATATLRQVYQKQLTDHVKEFDEYIVRRAKETRHHFKLFGYTHQDYQLRKGIHQGFHQANSLKAKRANLEHALEVQSITGGWRHHCADIIRKIIIDLDELIKLEIPYQRQQSLLPN